ncbi:DUF1738 domain-containing protein [Sphingobium phenoxybenzoativorans]|uniref:DUF1738 domain-containing protein n=1 Tax=Sphingobium phenoxybenzoativorans TaxID=1592790 RepID=A0A975Q0R1_9SPHN|nr:DUF1738 domain-containing protein [Sphingobium phenoxybenzoativorans]
MSAKGTGTHEGSAKRRGEQGRKRKERNRSRGGGRSRGGAGDDARPSGSAHARHALYDEITAKIVGELEQGHIPWVRPWASHGGRQRRAVAPALPRNALSGRPYSGINILILWSAMIEHGYASHGWLTFKQALEAGGCVRKGERGTSIVYADRFIPKGEAERAAQEGGDIRVVPFLKRFTIFNLAQCEGLDVDLGADPVPLPRDKIAPVAEELILASGADFRVGGDKAHFVHDLDYIAVPHQSAFYDPINYYRTALHELTHNAAIRIMPHVAELARLAA